MQRTNVSRSGGGLLGHVDHCLVTNGATRMDDAGAAHSDDDIAQTVAAAREVVNSAWSRRDLAARADTLPDHPCRHSIRAAHVFCGRNVPEGHNHVHASRELPLAAGLIPKSAHGTAVPCFWTSVALRLPALSLRRAFGFS